MRGDLRGRSQPVRERGHLPGPGEGGVGLAVDLGQDGVEDEVIQWSLLPTSPYSAAGPREAGGQGAHAQGRRPVGADDREGLGDDAVAGEHGAAVLSPPGGVNHSGRCPRRGCCCRCLGMGVLR